LGPLIQSEDLGGESNLWLTTRRHAAPHIRTSNETICGSLRLSAESATNSDGSGSDLGSGPVAAGFDGW